MKNFFYYNKTQRIGIIILIGLILLSIAATVLIPVIFDKSKSQTSDTEFLREAEKFRAGLIEKERQQRYERDFQPFVYRNNYSFPKRAEEKYELFAFNPNTADSATFVKLGLKPYIARNILKYRAKGGVYRTPEAFQKVYGISPEKFEELKPYIQIPEEYQVTKTTQRETEVEEQPKNERNFVQKRDDIIVELNEADTAQLKEIRGIGSAYARRIVSYRNVLGGYYSVEQVREVYGMRPEAFEQIKHSLTADGHQIRKIDINTASIERLRSHPYIKSFQKAKAIHEFRRKKVKLNNIDELKVLDELSEEDLRKLTPYLEFK